MGIRKANFGDKTKLERKIKFDHFDPGTCFKNEAGKKLHLFQRFKAVKCTAVRGCRELLHAPFPAVMKEFTTCFPEVFGYFLIDILLSGRAKAFRPCRLLHR